MYIRDIRTKEMEERLPAHSRSYVNTMSLLAQINSRIFFMLF